MSSKKLDSILAQVPPATARSLTGINNSYGKNIPEPEVEKLVVNNEVSAPEKYERIVAEVPARLKREIRVYLADHPKENERTVILRGLRALGFKISDEDLFDRRGRG